MKAKTEEFLYLLLWTCDTLANPTLRNLTGSFESWAYRNGLLPQLRRLEQRRLIERASGARRSRACRLTDAGRLHALGGRDPLACWNRPWDGRWRVMLYDLPSTQHAVRNRLRDLLRRRGFGYLQDSVWITPHPADQERRMLLRGPVEVDALILIEGRPAAGETDAQIVAAAWNFRAIRRAYAEHREVLSQRPGGRLRGPVQARAFQRWLAEERAAWRKAIDLDPLLPACLLPAGYEGRDAWRRRAAVMSEVAAQIRAFVAPDGV